MINTILIYHPDKKLRSTCEAILREAGIDSLPLAAVTPETQHVVRQGKYDMVLADFTSERQSFFEVLRTTRERHPRVPVVLLVDGEADDSMDQAIELGMFDSIQSAPVSSRELLSTIKRAAVLLKERREKSQFPKLVNSVRVGLAFKSGEFRLDILQRIVQDALLGYTRLSREAFLSIWLAIEEAVQNAHEHGNLELKSEWKEDINEDDFSSHFDEVKAERLKQSYYADRIIRIDLEIDHGDFTISVEDEGNGFTNREFENKVSDKVYGRGLTIIDNLMDSISFNKRGTRITMNKRLPIDNGSIAVKI